MTRLLTAALLCSVVMFARMSSVEAVTADNLTPLSASDVFGDCTQFVVDVSIANRTASIADAGVLDYYYIVVYDGNGNPHYSDDYAAQVPSAEPIIQATIDETYHGPVTALPLQIVMYDVDVAAIQPLNVVEAAPVVASATFMPPCNNTDTPNTPSTPQTRNDYRENTLSAFPYQPVAIYCESDERIDIYGIDTDSNGYLVLSVTDEMVESVGMDKNEHLLIAEADDVRLYRLNTGEFQVNAPLNGDLNGYTFIWEGCFG